MTDITKFWIFLLDFEMKTVCAVALVLFGTYFIIVKRMGRSQAQSISKRGILCALAFCVYVGMLLSGMLIDRAGTGEVIFELVPFWSYASLYREWNIYLALQIMVNVLILVPWGLLIPNIWPHARKLRWLLLSIGVFSTGVEILQLICKRGLFEFDDIFHNMLGAVIGYGIWQVGRRSKKV